jgi:hypothetical protein
MIICFTFDTSFGQFSDALIFQDGQPVPPDSDIEAMKLERLNNWLAVVNPPVEGT